MNSLPVDTYSPTDVRRFVEFPFALYRHCPHWVPPFRDEAYVQLNRDKLPFYRHSDAAFFLALRGGQVVGRIAVLDNRRYNAFNHTRQAFFYLFDAYNDPEA